MIPTEQTVSLEIVFQWLSDVRSQFSREIDQALLKRDLYQGIEALGGREACDRIKRQIEYRFHLNQSWQRELRPAPPIRAPLPPWYQPKKRKKA